MNTTLKWRLGAGLAVLLVAIGGAQAWRMSRPQGPGPGFISGNGRVEATEIEIATRMPGRVVEVLVDEGDMVARGQVVARMDPQPLLAARGEAVARERQARDAVAGALAAQAMRRGDAAAAGAVVVQRLSELDAAERRLRRSTTLAEAGAAPSQELDDDAARVQGARAAVAAAFRFRRGLPALLRVAFPQQLHAGDAGGHGEEFRADVDDPAQKDLPALHGGLPARHPGERVPRQPPGGALHIPHVPREGAELPVRRRDGAGSGG